MAPSLLQLTEQQNDQALEVAVGGKIIIALGCNRATGHGWSIAGVLPRELRADGDPRYNAPPPSRPTAWGEEVFTFVAATPGSARLRMAYGASDAPRPSRTFAVIINVRGDAASPEAEAPARGAASSKPAAKTVAKKTAPAKKAAAKKVPAKKAAAKKSTGR